MNTWRQDALRYFVGFIFSLLLCAPAMAATISGRVVNDQGIGLENVHLDFHVEACASSPVTGTGTDANGVFLVDIGETAAVCVRVNDLDDVEAYSGGWWNGTDLLSDCNGAAMVSGGAYLEIAMAPAEIISGTLTDMAGDPVADVCLSAYTEKNWNGWSAGGHSDDQGHYRILLPSAGDYYIYAHTVCIADPPPLMTEWWTSTGGTYDWGEAEAVGVVAGVESSDIDFVLAAAVTVDGHVTDVSGFAIADVDVGASLAACGQGLFGSRTDAQGVFSFSMPVASSYYVYAFADAASGNWSGGYWDGSGLVADCNAAAELLGNRSLNIVLAAAEVISGTVRDASGSPVAGICLSAFSENCFNNWVAGAQTDDQGDYEILVPAAGDYYVYADAYCQPMATPLRSEWWTSGIGTFNCNAAEVVTVETGVEKHGIDFWLVEVPEYPVPVIKSAGVASTEKTNGSISTLFYLYLSGPSPDEVRYVEIECPNGEELRLNLFNMPDRQRGNFYMYSAAGVMADGEYVFRVADTRQRELSVTREFIYDATVPSLDENSRSPENQAYVATTTPTLSFTSVGPEYYYKVYVIDSGGKAFWYTSEVSQATSFTVPEGFLQPYTSYMWFVRVFDGNGDPVNAQDSDYRMFYTGDGLDPSLASLTVVDLGPGSSGSWLGVWNLNVAPWESFELEVSDPEGGSYTLGSYSYYFNRSTAVSRTVTSPDPLPDGDYTFALRIDGGEAQTSTLAYLCNPLPAFGEGTYSPVDKSYLAAEELTFSWPALEDPAQPEREYFYRVRIADYNGAISVYDSEITGEPSITIPVAGNLAVGNSYMWKVYGYDAASGIQNQVGRYCGRFTVADVPLTADFSAVPTGGEAPLSVAFTEQAKGNVVAWNWDFGDGSTSAERNPSHAYTAGGRYEVSLEVRDHYGCDLLTRSAFVVVTDEYTPTLDMIGCGFGGVQGGEVVDISGSNFVAGTTVTFGGLAATSIEVVSSTLLRCIAPAHAAGEVEVVLTIPDGQQAFATYQYQEVTTCYVTTAGYCSAGPCYPTIAAAYQACAEQAVILVAAGDYAEALSANLDKSVSISGGWDAGFNEQTATAILSGPLTISAGSLNVYKLTVGGL
ncbi:MAG: carboxypeptidase regulatory-like domain-containing protein [Desulfuromonadales bacterium]|nr:carboxypeptidase regulatory-like domain-containing protein [Desulfuromonadales bacterium]